MYQYMILCSDHVCNMFNLLKHDWNMKSCSRTWFHVPVHEIMFLTIEHVNGTCNHVLEHEIVFWNMKSCSGTWFHVPEHKIMFRSCSRPWNKLWTWNHVHIHKACTGTWIHVLVHEIMFWNMMSCSDLVHNMFNVLKHDWNMKSCSRTWFHVQVHEIMFLNIEHVNGTCNHYLEHAIMFWNMISCSDHVKFMFRLNMIWTYKACSGTWVHVLEHDFMFRNMNSCSDHVQPEHDLNMNLNTIWTTACTSMFSACSVPYNMGGTW
jgi:hypothetical protein